MGKGRVNQSACELEDSMLKNCTRNFKTVELLSQWQNCKIGCFSAGIPSRTNDRKQVVVQDNKCETDDKIHQEDNKLTD